MIVNAHYRGKVGAAAPKFTYTGNYNIRKDGVVELLTSGTIVFLEPKVIDVFMVGGGGGGSRNISGDTGGRGYGGGGGGYTRTVRQLSVTKNTSITVTVGEGGGVLVNGNSSAFDTYTVSGGNSGTGDLTSRKQGGSGGSGGGGGVDGKSDYGAGGSDGSDGEVGYSSSATGGVGQGFSTREFGESVGKLYAGGGGGGRFMSTTEPVISMGGAGGGGAGGFYGGGPDWYQAAAAGVANTGGGGGGGAIRQGGAQSTPGASGGSGIVCFREAAELPELTGTWVLNERLYAPESNISQYTNFVATYGASTINCTRAQIKTNEVVITSEAGRAITIYTFSSNKWTSGSKYATWAFPTGATASDEFRAWLASNATKQ